MHRVDLRASESRTQSFPVFVKNERGEWELPGGKLDAGETPEVCVAREVSEELNLRVDAGPLLDAWVYRIPLAGDVLVVTHGRTAEDPSSLEHSAEPAAVGTLHLDELDTISIPDGYRRALLAWFGSRAGDRP